MQTVDLVELLKQPEGKVLEFKRDLSSSDGVLRSIVAFANTAGGVVLVGVEDRTRRVCGVADPLALEERLANLISDQIEPRLVPEIEILPWRRTHVVAARVHPSANRPHYLRNAGLQGGVYVRVGSTNRVADAPLVAEMQRFARNETFDERPMPELDSEALDFRAASESFAAIRKLSRAGLETLRLLTRHSGRLVPTVGGILLFGKERLRHFADAWIQAGRFRGTDKRTIDDHAEIRDDLIQAVEQAIGFVNRHSTRAAEIGTVRRKDRWNMPPAALREAVINAVVHADYSQRGAPIRIAIFDDRVEIENPGLLPFGLTVDDIRRGISKLRNRVIGRVFHELGLIEQWGSGIQRMTAACATAGLEPPRLEEIGTHFRVTIVTRRAKSPLVDDLDQAILSALAKAEALSTHEIAKAIRRSPRATRTRMLSLIESGLVVDVGTSPQDPRRRYYLAK